MNINKFLDEVTRREGKAVSVNRAQVGEVWARMCNVAYDNIVSLRECVELELWLNVDKTFIEVQFNQPRVRAKKKAKKK